MSQPSSTTKLDIPITAPAGAMAITQPPQASTSFFKIAQGQQITFGWNYTDVIATPTFLTVSAICANGNTYAIGTSIAGTATEFIWDPWQYDQDHPQTPLAQESYTLSIYDDRGPQAPRRPGFMVPNGALKFALYTPQAYTAINDGWQCTGCSRGYDVVAHPAFAGLVATLVVIAMSGWGLLRRNR